MNIILSEKILSHKLFSEIISLLFTLSFILYLILFLLETIYPGSISSYFSLNYILIPTSIFAALCTFFTPTEAKETPKKSITKLEVVVLIALSTCSFLFIYYKLNVNTVALKLAISLLSSALTLVLGIILLYFSDEQKNKKGKALEVNHHLHIPVPLALLFVIITLIFIPKNIVKILHTPRGSSITESPATPTITLPKANPNVHIFVYNAGAQNGDAKRFADIFIHNGFTKVEALNYTGENITNAEIQFSPNEASQSGIIEQLLNTTYSHVSKTPLATILPEIRVLLGSYQQPEENGAIDYFVN